MIQELGCSDDGSVWFNLAAVINGDVYRATVRLTPEQATDFHKSLGTAIQRGQTWLETGKDPGNENSGDQMGQGLN